MADQKNSSQAPAAPSKAKAEAAMLAGMAGVKLDAAEDAKKSQLDAIFTEEWVKSELSLEERFERCLSVGEECIKPEELKLLLEKKDHPIVYDGFEPSGRMHIAQGVMRMINVNKLTSSGCIFRFWVADWFALLNNKMGGDLKKIRAVGEYLIEIWKAMGMDMRNVQFLWASDEINAHADAYWSIVMDIARRFNIARIQRCGQIMGRSEKDELSAAQILYPCMQCADIFFLKADICQLGQDQRKVNMLAREYCDLIKRKFKPVILGHHMLMGLKQGQEKMSKSDPDSAIFMEDAEADVKRKIKKAYCPPGVAEENPILDYSQYVIFPMLEMHHEKNKAEGKETGFVLLRSEKNGGNQIFNSYEDLEKEYVAGNVHPGDLKPSVAAHLNQILEPVRKHFSSGKPKEMLAKIKKWKVTK